MRTTATIYVLLAFLIPQFVLAQKQHNNWYFGHNAGLSFASGSPVTVTGGQIYTDEGVASISSSTGNLLFYTDGNTIWNSSHQTMPNGTGLLGSFSSSQSAIIVPFPKDTTRYYVFTVEQLGRPNGLNYSVVNTSLDGGRGDVEVKNIKLQASVCEKLTAVRHCNGRDFWVVVHQYNSDAYLSYLVSPAGVSAAVVSHTGLNLPFGDEYAIGCMKASPDGKKIAAAHYHLGVDLCDFDNKTGVVSNGQALFLPSEPYGRNRGAYGVEFSPSGRYLYVNSDYNGFSILLQYDVSPATIAGIQATKSVVYLEPEQWATTNFGSLQAAPDGKIYMANFIQSFLSAINKPDAPGASCQFNLREVELGLAMSTFGLPSFIEGFSRPTFEIRGVCAGNMLSFDYTRSLDITGVKWDFGDPASGPNNTFQHIGILSLEFHVDKLSRPLL